MDPDDRDAEVARLLALGAKRVGVGRGEVPWAALADPEGPEGEEFDVPTRAAP